MGRRLAVLCARPEADPTARELLAVRRRGVSLAALDPAALGLRVPGGVTAGGALRFDAYLLRCLNPKDGCVQAQYDALELLALDGCRLINPPAALSLAESKLQTSHLLARAGVPTPRTVVAPDLPAARAALAEFGRAVLKPLYGSLGDGLALLGAGEGERILEERADEAPFYLQEYLPRGRRDLRVLALGERVLTAATREAPPGEWRANLCRGGVCLPCEPPAEAAEAALAAVRALGLDYGGVDLIEGPAGWLVIEVNGCPGWTGVARATGCDVAGALVDYALEQLAGQG